MTEKQILLANVLSNLVALTMFFASLRSRQVGRALFCVLFLWAGQINLRTALADPDVYLEYAGFAFFDFYRGFILGFFAQHTVAIVCTIALGQLAIAALVTLRTEAVELGLVGAMVFLIAIAPLGRGAAFPATLIAAAAAALLMRGTYPRSLPAEIWHFVHERGAKRAS